MFLCMKTSGFKTEKNPGANLTLVLSAVLIIGSAFVCRGGEANGYTPILYPSIFWHNNQWETYENGQWVPYRDPANNNAAIEAEPEEPVIPEQPQTPDMVDTNVYYPTYGWGFIGAPAFNRPHRRHIRTHVRTDHRRPETSIGQPNAGLGQPNAGIGRTTIGIGRPNTAIGRPTVGIGKPNAGIGQPTIGIGQPNVGIGQPNTSLGQPNVGIGSTTIGIGQPMTGQPSRSGGPR
jgi:hypothetical protein